MSWQPFRRVQKKTDRGQRRPGSTLGRRSAVGFLGVVVAAGLLTASVTPASAAFAASGNLHGAAAHRGWAWPWQSTSTAHSHGRAHHHSTAPTSTPTATPTSAPTGTPTATPTPTSTPTPSTTPTSTPTPSSTPTAPPTSTPVDPGTVYGWDLSRANTGLSAVGLSCAELPVYSGPSKPAKGTTITRQRVTGGLDLSNGGITLDSDCFQPLPGDVGQGMPVLTTTNYNTDALTVAPATVTIEHSDFDGSKLSVQEAAFLTGFIGVADLIGNYVSGFGSGLALMNTGETLNATVEGNYVAHLVSYGDPTTTGNHSDGFTIRDFDASQNPSRSVTVTDNRFTCDSDNCTGAFFIQSYSGRIDNATLSGNLMEGWGYQLGLNDLNFAYSNLTATDNRFSGTGFGATYAQRGAGWASWSSNYINDPSKPDNAGAAIAKPGLIS